MLVTVSPAVHDGVTTADGEVADNRQGQVLPLRHVAITVRDGLFRHR